MIPLPASAAAAVTDDLSPTLEVSELPHCGGAAVIVRPCQRQRRHLDEPQLAQLRSLLELRGILLLRGFCTNVDEFAALCRGLGPLHDDLNGPGRGRLELRSAGSEVHYISNLDLNTNQAMAGPTSMLSEANHVWHADYSWETQASRFTALFGVEVTEGDGAKTEIASTRRGFETLPPEMQKRCHNLTVLHRPGGSDSDKQAAKPNFAGTDQTAAGLQRVASAASSDEYDGAQIVRRPLLSRGALLLGRHAYHIEGGDDVDDNNTLLAQLTAHCLDEAHVYTHKWSTDDVLIWDNESTLHRAVPGVSGTRRHLARTVIAWLAGPQSAVADGLSGRL